MDINWSSFIQFQKTIGDSESENHPLSNEPTPVILIIIVWAQLANIWPPKKLEIRKSTTILEKAKNRFFSKSARWMIFYCLVSVSYSQGDIRTIEKQWVMSLLTWRFRQPPVTRNVSRWTRKVLLWTRNVPCRTRKVPGRTRNVPRWTRNVLGWTRNVPHWTRNVPR